jgi:hypothetical protein
MISNITSEPLDVLIELAGNPTTEPDVLAALSEDNQMIVRYLVYKNPNTPIDIYNKLHSQITVDDDIPTHCLGIDFSHSTDRHSDAIYRNVKKIVEFYSGKLIRCSTCGLDEDFAYSDEFEYASNVGIEFVAPHYVFTLDNGIMLTLSVEDWIADDIESMLEKTMGYEIISSDWY